MFKNRNVGICKKEYGQTDAIAQSISVYFSPNIQRQNRSFYEFRWPNTGCIRLFVHLRIGDGLEDYTNFFTQR